MALVRKVAAVATGLVGGVSLALFGVFMVWGPRGWVDMGLATAGALVVDGALSVAFFLQHSAMVRRSFGKRISPVISPRYHGAVYTVASGVVLLAVVFLWQETAPALFELRGPWRWALRALVPAAVIVFVWGVRSLGPFDAFGLGPLLGVRSGGEPTAMPLTVRGAYSLVRHPLYLTTLMVIWAYPVATWDRVLFNVSWTVWIVAATRLEERDLVATFGDPYRAYQKTVPMLVPQPLKKPHGG